MKGLFFNEDSFLQSLDLDYKIKKFILSFEEVFSERIIDEVFIVKCDGNKAIPIYVFCGHSECDKREKFELDEIKKIEEKKLKDFDFFIENILKNQCILNNEGLIAKDQMGGLFDAMFRMDNYYIGLNNTKYSFRELEEKIGVSELVFINIVKKFYSDIKKT